MSETRSRIGILLPDLRGGGVERIRLVLAHEFLRMGHAPEFVLMQPRGELLEEAEAAFPVHDLGCTRMRQLPFALARHLRRHRPDTLLAAMWPLTGAAGIAGRLARYSGRIVGSEHVDFRATPSRRLFERLALKHCGRLFYAPCDRIIAVSSGVAESLSEAAALPRERVTVIHNPVRPFRSEEMTAEERQQLSGWLNGQSSIIAIGTLKRQKRFDVLIRALAKVRQRLDARLLILGEGSLRGELERLAAELGIAGSVWLPGFKANPGTFLQHSNAFVLSSDYEGFGNVVVEALSAGVPVVSTDCPSGPAEILSDGRYGALVPVDDHLALADAIVRTIVNPIRADLLIKRSRDFSPRRQARQYLQIMLSDSGASKSY